MALLVNAEMTVASAPGTGAATLSAATAGSQTAAAAGAVDGGVYSYRIADQAGNWEFGKTAYAASSPSIARTTVRASSNGGAAVNFAADAVVTFVLLDDDLGPTLDDFRTLAIQVAKLKGSALGLAGGTVDDFKDSSGIDTANSSGYSYDATNNLVVLGNAGGLETTQSLPPMTGPSSPAGYTASATNPYSASYDGWVTADQNNSTYYTPTSGQAQTLSRTFPSLSLGGIAVRCRPDSAVHAPKDFAIQTTTDGSTWTTQLTPPSQTGWAAGERRAFTLPNVVPGCVGCRLAISTSASGTYVEVAEFEILKGTAASAGTLRSVAFTAQAVPSKGGIFFLAKATTGTITPNTNLIAEIARDGTTFTAGTLAQAGTAGGFLILEANLFSLASQPSAQMPKFQIRTVGTAVVVAVDAIVAQWG